MEKTNPVNGDMIAYMNSSKYGKQASDILYFRRYEGKQLFF